MIHELKIAPEHFRAILSGEKTFEVRVNDRDYRTGDFLALNEYLEGGYSGKCVLVQVPYILSDAIYCKDGYVIMSIKPCRICGDDYNRVANTPNYGVFAYDRTALHMSAYDGTEPF